MPTCPLEKGEWGACVAAGATPLLIAAILKASPESWVSRINVDKFVDENKATEASGILKKYNETKNIKVTEIKKGGLTPKGEDNDFKQMP